MSTIPTDPNAPPNLVERIYLAIPGEPRGQGRPRFARVGAGVRTYTDAKTAATAVAIRAAWMRAGRPRLADGPVRLKVLAMLARPKGHYRRDGYLSAAGLRSKYPTRKPDVSNVLKLCEDALNGLAWRDDACIYGAEVVKVWQTRDLAPCTIVQAWVVGSWKAVGEWTVGA